MNKQELKEKILEIIENNFEGNLKYSIYIECIKHCSKDIELLFDEIKETK